MKNTVSGKLSCLILGGLLVFCSSLAPRLVAADGPSPEKIEEAVRRGTEYLIRMQRLDGSWNGLLIHENIGMTAHCGLALVKKGIEKNHPAILQALNYLEQTPLSRTYDLAATLMLLETLDGEKHRKWIHALAEGLVSGCKEKLWAYPGGPVDMSNTQYAAMALDKAEACGFKAGSKLWEGLAEKVLDIQCEDGGWGYRQESQPTGSMTCAGLTCLLMCRKNLEKYRYRGRLTSDIKRSLQSGINWLDAYFEVEKNPMPFNEGASRWDYYYLYGLERIAALDARRFIGEHNWYNEGAAHLLSVQNEKGAWTCGNWGESEMNTGLALFFLTRATQGVRTTESRQSMIAASQAGPGKTEVRIACDHKNPVTLWLDSWSENVAEKFGIRGGGQALRVRKVDYFAGDVLLGTVEGQTRGQRVTRLPLRHRFEENGDQQVYARLECVSESGLISETFESNRIQVFVHNNITEAHKFCMADLRNNLLLRKTAIRTEASSTHNRGKHGSDRVADGRQSTAWISAKEDTAPWVRIELDKPQRADRLKLSHAMDHVFNPGHFSTACRVRVLINRGSQKLVVDLDVDETKKYLVTFKRTRVKEIRVEVLDRIQGKGSQGTGFSEIELFDGEEKVK